MKASKIKESKIKDKVYSLRLNPIELAKARDGLLTIGTPPDAMTTISQIIRLTFYYGILANNPDPKATPSEGSLAFIQPK